MDRARTSSRRHGAPGSDDDLESGAPVADSHLRDAQTTTQTVDTKQGQRNLPPTVLLVAKRATARDVTDTLTDGVPGLRTGRKPNAEFDLGHIRLVLVTSQKAALQLVKAESPQVAMVEIENRPQSRLRFCRMLRNRAPAMSIFAIGDKRPVGSFEFEHFLPLPLEKDQLIDSLNLVRDRCPHQEVVCGPFRLDPAMRAVHTPDGIRHLTPKLAALLELLMVRHDEVVSRSDIMRRIWETSYLEDTRTLDVHMRWLRENIEPDPSQPQYLVTVRGTGYTFRTL